VEKPNGHTDVAKLLKLWGELEFALQFHGKMEYTEPVKG
jgi:hypothetical protein